MLAFGGQAHRRSPAPLRLGLSTRCVPPRGNSNARCSRCFEFEWNNDEHGNTAIHELCNFVIRLDKVSPLADTEASLTTRRHNFYDRVNATFHRATDEGMMVITRRGERNNGATPPHPS